MSQYYLSGYQCDSHQITSQLYLRGEQYMHADTADLHNCQPFSISDLLDCVLQWNTRDGIEHEPRLLDARDLSNNNMAVNSLECLSSLPY